jgi:hypothetical protein
MSVYFEADIYADALDQIAEFEKEFDEKISQPLSLRIAKCSVDNVFALTHMNYTGRMKQFESNFMRENWEKLLFSELADAKNGEFCFEEKKGIVFQGQIFPSASVPDIKSDILGMGCSNVFSAIEFQRMGDEDKNMTEIEVRNRYLCADIEESKTPVINLTYLIAFAENTEQYHEDLKRTVMNLYDRREIYMIPCDSREADVFQSLCSIGMMEYHNMCNASVELAKSLYI